jgi:hypothetical protein
MQLMCVNHLFEKRQGPVLLGYFVSVSMVVFSILFPFMLISSVVHASPHASDSSNYIDAVLVIDNVDQIKNHDPDGDRFTAAQLFVDLALPGDKIGVVKISNSQQASPIAPLTEMNNSNKAKIKSLLSQQTFGPIENPPAYISPPLQLAGHMLQTASDNNRHYVILVTDAVALSDDSDNCPDAPPLHNWFCAAGALQQQHISVILIGFTKPGSEDALQPTQAYIQAHGGTVLQVEDGGGLAQRLALAYTDLLTRIHTNVFAADVAGAPDSLTFDPPLKLIGVTFVALGDPGITLGSVQTPHGDQVAGKTTDSGFYSAASPGNASSGYALETVSSGNLPGTWHLGFATTTPSDVLVVAVSEARFNLLNPSPTDPYSDVSVRLIPLVSHQGSLALRARVTDGQGNPITVPLVADPTSANKQPFTTTALPPLENSSDVGALLEQTNGNSGDKETLQVGLGGPLPGNVYLTKSFTLILSDTLQIPQLTTPEPTVLQPGAGIPVTAQGTPGVPGISKATLALYSFDPNATWSLISASQDGGASAKGTFSPAHGCGYTYTLAALEEAKGEFNGQQYDYLGYAADSYPVNFIPVISGLANLHSESYLEWWPSQKQWAITFDSTVCSNQTVKLGTTLNGMDYQAPSATIEAGSGYTLDGSSASFTLVSGSHEQRQVAIDVGSCSWSWLQDHRATLKLVVTEQPSSGGPVVQSGTWQTVVTCPSVLTNAGRHPLVSSGIFLLLTIIFAWLIRFFRWMFSSKPHLVGNIQVFLNAPDPQAPDPGETLEPLPITIPIPLRHSAVWYLDRNQVGDDVSYGFESLETNASLIRFAIKTDAGGQGVVMRATKHATGVLRPILLFTNLPLSEVDIPVDGEPLAIGEDHIEAEITISS